MASLGPLFLIGDQKKLFICFGKDHRPDIPAVHDHVAASSHILLLRHQDLVPLNTRIRTRLCTEAATRDELLELLKHALAKAGNATLMTEQLMDVLVDHSAGNYRLLMTMSAELLAYGTAHEVSQLDEKFYLELFHPKGPTSKKKARA